jgi:hypothetical protein
LGKSSRGAFRAQSSQLADGTPADFIVAGDDAGFLGLGRSDCKGIAKGNRMRGLDSSRRDDAILIRQDDPNR